MTALVLLIGKNTDLMSGLELRARVSTWTKILRSCNMLTILLQHFIPLPIFRYSKRHPLSLMTTVFRQIKSRHWPASPAELGDERKSHGSSLSARDQKLKPHVRSLIYVCQRTCFFPEHYIHFSNYFIQFAFVKSVKALVVNCF